jgi:FkbM family methyltransferase
VKGIERMGLAPATVIDVGANTGQFAVAAAMLFPGASVHSFEPLPEQAGTLRKNVSKLPCIKVYQIALGESAGKARLFVNKHSHSSSILPLGAAHKEAFPGAQVKGEITVDVAALDEALGDVEMRRPVLLKMDAQGYEKHILMGASKTLSRIDYVLAEISFTPLYEGEAPLMDIFKILEAAGFVFSRPVGWLASPRSGELLQMDALFIRK